MTQCGLLNQERAMNRFVLLCLVLLMGCGNKLSLENYRKIGVGMPYDNVVQLIGKPDRCDDVMGLRNCTWGDASRSINVSFAGGKTLLFGASNLK
jgi:hypothetical protein